MPEKEWLANNRFYYPIDDAKLQSIFYFSLIWNIYEKELCNKDGRIGNHPNEHSKNYAGKVDQRLLSSVFEYFKNRYIASGQPTEQFITFEFKSELIKSEVLNCLTMENPSCEEMIEALLKIAFRLRNNLFHGEKQIEKLYEQNENFKQINLLLMNLIENR
ncbi:MAG: hypothetical protein CTY35_04835 [Methylotenera sp.]|jgi:hypothetical protein|uniref:hypothetical protein n=1 Tax=Methylotenera TaxID=359407 RepID=UPI00037692DB|nr:MULTISPECIES: hypothetical protein [Methylotenera]MDP3777543.1 hypothetical protein [Methylotenera sp.]PPC97448.1 MAG: hypothetical protein CTY32_01605 [Methylotenera sp.]PPC98693.1 MAG: hypothetical protein CTY35_04835 [Methylotenera sp.]